MTARGFVNNGCICKIVAALALLSLLMPGILAGEEKQAIPYLDALKCGQNALYLFMRLEGTPDVELDRLNKIPLSQEGASLLELRKAASNFRLETEVRHYQSNQVGSLPLPAIARLNSQSASVTPHHYVVPYKIAGGRVYFLDGTTGEKKSGTKEWFGRFWTGYALIKKPSLGAQFPTSTMALAGLTLANLALVAHLVSKWK